MSPPPSRWLLHLDLDAFLAAVEVRRHPEFRGRPVVVGGDGDPTRPRQVVATASYEARVFGVRSGMPLIQARRRCPDAVFLRSDHPAYDAASVEVMEVVRGFGHPVEVWGWDEAVLGADVDDPEALAVAVQERVRIETGLTCAVGIGDTKERAKTATRFAKAGGDPGSIRVFRITAGTWLPLMGHRDLIELWGIGPRTARRLTEQGLRTVAELAAADPDLLVRAFGPTTGPRLRLLARGGASRTVHTESPVARSRSHQVTYPVDLTTPEQIAAGVTDLARAVTAEVAAEGRTVSHVAVTVRTSTFFTQVRTGKLPIPTTDPEAAVSGALRVLARFEISRPVRLLGVRVDLSPPASPDPALAPPASRGADSSAGWPTLAP